MKSGKAHVRSSARRGIQSVSRSYLVLDALARTPTALFLREVAASVGMPTSKVYRYLASFLKVGLVVQDNRSGKYDLGPAAIQLGLAALGKLDEMAVAVSGLEQAASATNLDAHLTVWGDRGPTIVRWIGRAEGLHIRISEGMVLPLRGTATGRVWEAFLPASKTKHILAQEARADRRSKRANASSVKPRQSIAGVRLAGVSVSQEERRKGVDAIAGPIFDRDGKLIFVITLMSLHGETSLKVSETPVRVFLKVLREISNRLGHVDKLRLPGTGR